MSANTRICDCTTQQYANVIFNNVAYQNSANVIYNAKNTILLESRNGTLGAKATGQPVFKSDYERMQYLLGTKGSAGAGGGGCGVSKKTFTLGPN